MGQPLHAPAGLVARRGRAGPTTRMVGRRSALSARRKAVGALAGADQQHGLHVRRLGGGCGLHQAVEDAGGAEERGQCQRVHDREGRRGQREAGDEQQQGEQHGADDAAAGDADQVLDPGEAPVLLRQAERQAAEQQGDGAAARNQSGCSKPPPGSAIQRATTAATAASAPSSATLVRMRKAERCEGHAGHPYSPPGCGSVPPASPTRSGQLARDRCIALPPISAFCACLALLSAAAVWGMTRVGVIDTPGERSSHTPADAEGRRGRHRAGVPGGHAGAVPVR